MFPDCSLNVPWQASAANGAIIKEQKFTLDKYVLPKYEVSLL
jgi:hypothetical protein